MNDIRTNCKNCGAPLTDDHRCEYCGTSYLSQAIRSSMEITSNCIRLVCDELKIGKVVAPIVSTM